ncbi:hypothetical protein SS50377_21954 [Spironucleus salmonicida]|uniref:Uncharacterized protein n=1 Tax=Spironucleus salmonicida TaxID=348837 RepID=A0A9P8S0X3_9EUKA|nr:hypothetical protein SS50377_21943 [Spironucleus salmonicida]KAH0576390.1 hypothetical protein SS50377_21954 [Spironucleus salmonicida]
MEARRPWRARLSRQKSRSCGSLEALMEDEYLRQIVVYQKVSGGRDLYELREPTKLYLQDVIILDQEEEP